MWRYGGIILQHGYNDEKSKVLYLAAKDNIPNAIILTYVKKHFHEVMNERQHNEESSGLFFYVPLITDHKQKINQYRKNVNLNRIDCNLKLMSSFLPDKVDFQPYLFDSRVTEKRDSLVELLYKFLDRWLKRVMKI